MSHPAAPFRLPATLRPLCIPLLPGALFLVLAGIAECPSGDEDGDGFPSDEDCNDQDAGIHPGAPELCDGIDNDCDDVVDEGSPTEVCDGLDNDCDGAVDEGLYVRLYPDQDGDGFGRTAEGRLLPCPLPAGHAEARGDCNDAAKATHPGAPDKQGDGIDQDCGGADGQQPSVGLEASGYTAIKAALEAAADGHTVWVGPGLYPEYALSPLGKALTLISTHGAERTVIQSDKGGILWFNLGEGQDTIVDGLTLAGGRDWEGAGVYVRAADPIIRNCIIRDNGYMQGTNGFAAGAGIFLDNANARIENCIITGNMAGEPSTSKTAVTAYGGGIYMTESKPTIRGCTIDHNVAEALILYGKPPTSSTVWGEAFGGGIYGVDSWPIIVDTTISDNLVLADGYTGYMSGGGVRIYRGGATFTNCRIERNSWSLDEAFWGTGGGLYVDRGDVMLENTRVAENVSQNGGGIAGSGSMVMTNSLVEANVASSSCAALAFSIHNAFSLSIINSVFVNNQAPSIGGVNVTHYSGNDVHYEIINSIAAYNDDFNLLVDTYPSGGELPVLELDGFVSYNPPGEPNHNLAASTPGLLVLEPGFLRYAQGAPSNVHLATGSGLVDAGRASLLDPDGTRSDIGLYGGPLGDAFDLDRDQYPDYFWPGELSDAPAGFDPSLYDSNDLDFYVH